MSENDNITTQVAYTLKDPRFGKDQNRRVHDTKGHSPAIQTCGGGNREPKILEPAVLTKERTEEGKRLRKEEGIDNYANKQYVPRTDGCSGTLTSVQKDNYLAEPSIVS